MTSVQSILLESPSNDRTFVVGFGKTGELQIKPKPKHQTLPRGSPRVMPAVTGQYYVQTTLFNLMHCPSSRET